MKWKFKVGMKVISKPHVLALVKLDSPWNEIMPEIGVIYTIRSIHRCNAGHLALVFEEIRNEPHQYAEGFMELGSHEDAFEPVSDITIFQKIAADVTAHKVHEYGI